MRLVKMGKAEFPDEAALRDFFDVEFPRREPPGKFRFTTQIGDDGLYVGEPLLFSWDCTLCYVATVKGTRRRLNEPGSNYRYYFVIDMDSVLKTHVSLHTVQDELRRATGFDKSLVNQGWTRIPDSKANIDVITRLVT